MKVRSPLLLLLLRIGAATCSGELSAESPFLSAAKEEGGKLAAGCVIVAEVPPEGPPVYQLSGTDESVGVPPEHQIFEIGSISKVFTGLLLAIAESEGRVSPDTKLGDLLPPPSHYKDPAIAAITLRGLATHTSGLPRLPGNLNPKIPNDPYAGYARKDLEDWLAMARLEGPSPHLSSYSNLGMGLLGDLLARVYGQTWEDLVKEKITRPLGMTDTVVTLSPEQAKRFVPPHAGKAPSTPWTFQALAGAGALRSTAADLVTFARALASPERTPLASALLLQRKPLAESGSGGRIGLALMLDKIDGEETLEHGGGTGGYRSYLQVFPGNGHARILLCNNAEFTPEAVLTKARPNKEIAIGKGKGVDAVPLTEDQLQCYRGVYALGQQAKITVVVSRGRLRVRLTGQPFLPVFARGHDRFYYDSVAAELQFEKNDDLCTSVTLHQNGKQLLARRTTDPVPDLIFRRPEALAPYAGRYQMPGGNVFTVKLADDHLMVQLTGQPFLPVFEVSADRFEYDVVSAALIFQKDDAGKVTRLILQQNGTMAPAIRK